MTKLILIIASLFTITAFGANNKKHKQQAQPKPQQKEYVRPYGTAGCGLGAVLIGRRNGQIFAATTNATSGNQTFAISSGTLLCDESATSNVAGNMDRFIMANKAALAADIARGNGETVTALGQVMGCSSSSRDLGPVLQKNYNKIFSENDVQSNIVTDNIITVLMNDEKVAGECNLG